MVQVQRVSDGLDDPQLRTNILAARSRLAYVAGDLAAACREADLADEVARGLHMSDQAWLLQLGMETRDPGRLAGVLASDGPASRTAMATMRATRAALDALAGDASSLAVIDAACDEIEAAGVFLTAALLRGARALMVPEDPGARPAAEAAAAFHRRVGAVTMLARLAPFLEAGVEAAPTPVEPTRTSS
jgi:hypothetical protein